MPKKFTLNRQKGGLQINNLTAKDAFEHFISNSKISLLSNGSFGLTFVAKLNPGVQTNYKHLLWYKFDEPVDIILFKLCCLYNKDAGEPYEEIDITINNKQRYLGCVDVKEFEKEVNIQTDIYFKSLSYLQPYCPGIVYANKYTLNSNTQNLLNIIANNMTNESNTKLIKSIQSAFIGKDFSGIGLIGMEFLEGYNTLYRQKQLTPKMDIYNSLVAIYLLIKVAVDTGYTHGDFHENNILINVNDTGYFHQANLNNVFFGTPMLIDFGLSKKISPENQKDIKDFYEKKDWQSIMVMLCNLGRSDGLNLYKYEVYDWICLNLNFPKNVMVALDFLFKQREKQIDSIVKIFNKLHDTLSSTYPLLPISNSIKNKLYSGMIEPTPFSTTDELQNSYKNDFEKILKTAVTADSTDSIDVGAMVGLQDVSSESSSGMPFKFSAGTRRKYKKKRNTRKNNRK